MQPLNLALQGGGSHGAFTWGVLDALLQSEAVGVAALSGTSAGAVNAVALASGWAGAARSGRDPRQGARDVLRAVWDEVAALGAYGSLQRQLLRALFGPGLLPLADYASPLAFNPLRQLLQRLVDFEALKDPGVPRVHVGATHVGSGGATIFSGEAVTLDAVLASACLPQLFAPVVIGGETYWDGGYSVNPPLVPFLQHPSCGDVLIVQINPVRGGTAPATPLEIRERVNEVTFNAGLLTQLRAVEHFNKLADRGLLPRERRLRLHRIDGGESLRRFPQSTRGSADPGLVRELFAAGQDAAAQWLREHGPALGHRGTLPYPDYVDDTWLHFADRGPLHGPGTWRARIRMLLGLRDSR